MNECMQSLSLPVLVVRAVLSLMRASLILLEHRRLHHLYNYNKRLHGC